MILDWLRSRTTLMAEVKETREALAVRDSTTARLQLAEEEIIRLRAQRRRMTADLDEVKRTLMAERVERAAHADYSTAPATSDRAALLKERARADALARRVGELQEANMSRDWSRVPPAQAGVSGS